MTGDDRVAEIVGRVRERRDRGETVALDDVVREHPDLAAELRRRFEALRMVEASFARRDETPARSLEGRRIGPYRMLSLLGAGGMGTVHLAVVEGRAPGLAAGARVAVKVVHPHLLARHGFFKRFLREAEIGRRLRHENVVRTLDADVVEEGGERLHFFVMEHVEGQTLRALLDDLQRVPEELCRHVGREAAKALAAIHEAGAVHRDLKPENVLITKEHVVKVMDLGVARLADEAMRLSQTGAFVGSVRYAAPEQFGGGAKLDGRADLYALGLTLYELATGSHPLADEDFHVVLRRQMTEVPRPAGALNPQVSPFFEELLRTLLEKDRERRVASAAELVRVLDEGEGSAWWRERSSVIRAATKRPLRRIRIPRETALYGRDAEIAKLRALYERAKAGEGQVVLVEGEAGIGKSRLVDEFVTQLAQAGEDVNFLFGSYLPGGAATASGAFSTAYREHLGDHDAAVREALPQTPLLVPAFAALLRGDATPEGVESLTKDSLQTVFVHATRSFAAQRPTVVLIDDLHFAPEEGRALFASLALAVPGHRILLVGTARPGIDEKWLAQLAALSQASQLAVPRLGPKELVHLLRDALRSERLAEELGVLIAVKSDGNPFFVFEMLRGLKEGQFLEQRPDGTWHTTQVIRDIQVPSSILDLVKARVADLATAERDLLDVASCCGFEFDPALVAAAVGQGRIPMLKSLAQIERAHRLVRSSGRRFVFDHHQVQEALYGSLPEGLREEYHGSIAAALEAQHDATAKQPTDIDGVVCVDLAEHFLKGAQGARALRYLDPALTHLEKGYLNDAAILLAERALAEPGLLVGAVRARTLLRLQGRLNLLGRRERQRAAIEEALALARESGDRPAETRAERGMGIVLSSLGRLVEAQQHQERALALARETLDRQGEAWATGNLGVVLESLGRYPEAQEHQERALALAREIGDRTGEATATGNLGTVLYALGRYAEARERLEGHLSLARENGDRHGEALAAGNLGAVFHALGRYAEAREHHARHLALAREIGDRRGEARATGNLGTVFQSLGRFAEAREQFERRLAFAREIGDRHGEAMATGGLGNVFLSLGRYSEAQEHYERSLAVAREIGDRRGEARAMGNLGGVLHSLGRYAEAREHLERQLALAREIGDRQGEALATVNLGGVCLNLGRFAEARERCERTLALAREIGNRSVEGHALGALASVACESGDAASAERLVTESLDLRRSIGARSEEADSLLARGALRARAGRNEEARADLEAALALARDLSLADVELAALAHLASLPGGDASAALAALATHGDRVEVRTLMESRFVLWQATREPSHLAEAKRLLDFLVEHAPPECRESMLTNVRLHREIVAAARDAASA